MSFDFNNYLVPTVIEQSGRGERVIRHLLTPFERAHRFLDRPGDRRICQSGCCAITVLGSENPDKDIFFYINSPGRFGYCRYVDLRHHELHQASCFYFMLGQAASMGAFLLSAGEKGKRFALPNSRIMIHQPLISGGLAGQASDIKFTLKSC